jgi:hypothetical protein
MLTGMCATMRMQMRRNKHRKPMMDQRTMWRTEGIVQESVKIGQYISDIKYNNGVANATASDVSEAKTVLQSVTKSQS